MSVTSPELIETRRDEIINVCETLYKTMSFKEINIKEIGKITSFGRTSIYNYFKTKEEIPNDGISSFFCHLCRNVKTIPALSKCQ